VKAAASAAGQALLRIAALLALAALALQLAFLARIALMAAVDPQSTTFQRSEAWRLLVERQRIAWAQEWVPYERISPHLKRAVIASEDAGFTDHFGIDWESLEQAWERQQRNEQRMAQGRRPGKVVGGSTISQQLAKNLLLSGERTLLRKGQELVLTVMNNVEWGEGLFGAQAAARHYFRVDAERLSPEQAARMAVMLPAPKRFEKRPASAYVIGRAATIQARMGDVVLP
jgi:monofunctional biosynthetic peptidoglycan transglycosylase